MLRPGTDRKYASILLFAALVVLALGLLLKPRQPEPKAAPSETELAQLQHLTQQRRLEDLSSYLTDAAETAASSLVFVGRSRHSGVLWDSQPLLITAKAPSETRDEQPSTVTRDGRTLTLQRRPLQPGAPFSVFSFTPAPWFRGARGAATPPNLGDWVLAVARNAEGGVVFAHGLYQGLVESRCGPFAYRSVQSSAAVSTALLGGGAFTLDGQLLGIISVCDQQPIVVAIESIAATLRQPPSMNRRLEDYYGFRVAEATRDGARAANSVQVVSVWAHSRGEEAGLRPGDVVLAADGQPVQSREDLEALVAGGKTERQLSILRGRQRLTIILPEDAPAASVTTSYGLTLSPRPQDRRVRVAAVAADSSAQRAGILPGDLLLSVGDTPIPDAAAAMRALKDARATRVLTLEREGREYEVLLKP